jgi:hypothetical protein
MLEMSPPSRKVKVYKPTKFGEGMQPGTAEWEQNRRKLLKEQRAEDRAWAKMQATRSEREREPRNGIWRQFFRIFLRYWPD